MTGHGGTQGIQASGPGGVAVADEKKAWRAAVRRLFALVDGADRTGLDALLRRRCGRVIHACARKSIAVFSPMTDEPDLFPLYQAWLAEGKRLAFPVWNGGCGMTWRWVDDLGAQLVAGRSGIREPLADLSLAAPGAIDVALVPGRAFSETCQRLGRGAGCYDVFLGGGKVTAIGVAYDFQIFPWIPCGENDKAMDLVLTPGRSVYRRERRIKAVR